MKIINSLFIGVVVILMTGCAANSNQKNPEKWTKAQASEWFNKKDWLGQTTLQPDTSFDKKVFAVHYFKNKEWWDKAFNFLKTEDLSAVTAGVHELDGQNVYVKVTEYNSKNREDVPFEVHKEYTDIQYVVSGTEYIEMADQAGATLKTAYDQAKDIAFYDAKERESHIGKPGVFFLIFSDTFHRSGIKVDSIAPVKKIVIKVKN